MLPFCYILNGNAMHPYHHNAQITRTSNYSLMIIFNVLLIKVVEPNDCYPSQSYGYRFYTKFFLVLLMHRITRICKKYFDTYTVPYNSFWRTAVVISIWSGCIGRTTHKHIINKSWRNIVLNLKYQQFCLWL